jgi:hypothetical protein
MIKRISANLCKAMTIAAIFLLLGILLSYTYFRVFKDTSFRVPESLPLEITHFIDNRMDQIDIVNGIQVVRVDLKRNVRYIVYARFTDPRLMNLYTNFSQSRITIEIPVFTDDDVQNARVIRLMNHEFDCTPYKNTLSYKLVPESAKYATTVCSISIPPAFGEFRGMLALTLSREPTELEMDMIRTLLKTLSDKVYPAVK